MRRLLCLIIISACAIGLNACATMHEVSGKTEQVLSKSKVKKTTTAHYIPTDPTGILLTHQPTLKTHYKVIGNVAINQYNFVGIRRQQGIMDDLFQKHAAEIGGNAVINIHVADNNNEIGQVIKFVS